MVDTASGVGCVEPGVTPFEESSGDGDDEPDIDHTPRELLCYIIFITVYNLSQADKHPAHTKYYVHFLILRT
mgnify:CR=1 FL=1